MWAVLWVRRFPSQASCGTWIEWAWWSSLEVKQPVHKKTAELQEWIPGKAMAVIHSCHRESVGVYLAEGESTRPPQRKQLAYGCDQSPLQLPGMGTMVWHDRSCQIFDSVSAKKPAAIWACFPVPMFCTALTYSLEDNKRVFSFFSSLQDISVVQEDLQDSEGFYELRSTLMLQGTHEIHKTFSCACLFPFPWNETRNISSEEIFVSFGRFFIDRTYLKC